MCVYNLHVQFVAQYNLLDSALEDPSYMETESIMIKYIHDIVRGIDKQNERLKKSVRDFYEKLLKPVEELISQDELRVETKERLQCCFKDIYWSLKVHVMFYRRIDNKRMKTEDKVSNLGIPSPRQTKQFRNQESAVHPKTKSSKRVGREATKNKYKTIDHQQVSQISSFHALPFADEQHRREVAGDN